MNIEQKGGVVFPRAEEVLWCNSCWARPGNCIHGIVPCMSFRDRCLPPHCTPCLPTPKHVGFGWDLNAILRHHTPRIRNTPCLGTALFGL
jgi:hypothetical protein